MKIINIPILQTNYIWLIYNQKHECILIDPGESLKTLQILAKFKLTLKAILLTHDHIDHTNGTHMLIQYFPNIKIFGPKETEKNGTNIIVSEGSSFFILEKKFNVLNLPGHTPNHIGFYSAPWLFCGDTVFSAGCGKVYTGLIYQMYKSFLKISALPHDTLIFSGHEYTLSNINFALSILPENKFLINYKRKIIQLLRDKKSTIPTTLRTELIINPFFLHNNTNVKKKLNLYPKLTEEWKIFRELRRRKDIFNEI